MDIAAKLAALRAQKAKEAEEKKNEKATTVNTTVVDNSTGCVSTDINTIKSAAVVQGAQAVKGVQPSVLPMAELNLFTPAAANTTKIDHLDFMQKLNALQEAIHFRHPTMPVLLFQIHTQLSKDPEVVTLLDEDGIGVIVKGLEIQTKTEIMGAEAKKIGVKGKKVAVSVDMF